MKKALGLLVVCTLVLASANLTPKHLGHRMPMDQLERLLSAAVKYSRYSKPVFARPTVWVLTPEEFAKEVCESDDPSTCYVLGQTSREWPYAIVVRSPSAPEQDPDYAQSVERVVVHEMIHWLQIQQGGLGVPRGQKESVVNCAEMSTAEVEAYDGAYRYAIEVEHVTQGFWLPQTYERCIAWKLSHGQSEN